MNNNTKLKLISMSCCKEEFLKTKKGYKYVELIFGRKPVEKKKVEKRPAPVVEKENIEVPEDKMLDADK